MELNEAIKEMKSLSPSEIAIETVLGALKDKDEKIEKLKEHNKTLIKEKQELSSNLLDSIPKEKIEEKLKNYEERKKDYKNMCKKSESIINKEVLIRFDCKIKTLQELLEDK